MDIHFSRHWKRRWCWAKSRAGGEGDDRGWECRMASPTRWTWLWASPGRWWWTGKPGVLELDMTERLNIVHIISNFLVIWVPSGSIFLRSLVLLTNQNMSWFLLLLLNSVILCHPAVVHLGPCLHAERSRHWTGFLLFQNFALVQNWNSPPHL